MICYIELTFFSSMIFLEKKSQMLLKNMLLGKNYKLLELAYLGAYGAHMFALRVWVKNSPLGQSVSICLFVPLFDPLPIKLFQI